MNDVFRHVETLFIQGNIFIRPGPLLVGRIAPTNSGPRRIKTLPWMNKVSTCQKALLDMGILVLSTAYPPASCL